MEWMMRDKQHYLNMFDRNPNASIRFTLAAAAVYAARYGVCEPDNHSTEEWKQIARDLKVGYGETLTRDEVLFEMAGAIVPDDLITQARAVEIGAPSVQAVNNAIRDGRLRGYPNYDAQYQRQGATLVSESAVQKLWGVVNST